MSERDVRKAYARFAANEPFVDFVGPHLGAYGYPEPKLLAGTNRAQIGFAIDPESLPEGCRATHVNLNDGTLEGFAVEGRSIFAVQYHPEAAPGPHDASPLFDSYLAAVGSASAAR